MHVQINILILALKCAVVAYVYSVMLTDGGKLLNGWYRFLQTKIGNKKWLFYPLIHCDECVAGQMALWSYLYLQWKQNFQTYDLGDHIVCISISILVVPIIGKIITWSKTNR